MLYYVLKIIHISRPRLWLYTLGSFLFGVQIAVFQGYVSVLPSIFPFILMLTLPVNLFAYAVNDYFDSDTDSSNPKKDTYEHRATQGGGRQLLHVASFCAGLIVVFAIMQSVLVASLIILWLAIIYTYNVPPFRLKARPVWDMIFAFNFPLWGVIGYVVVAGIMPEVIVYVPLVFFAIAAHLYTAIHDREHDASTGVYTSAVLVGSLQRNIQVCVVCMIPGVLYFLYLQLYLAALVACLYPLFFVAHLYSKKLQNDLLYAYKGFIWLHYVIGFLISIALVLSW